MILSIQRKIFDSDQLDRTPVTINKTLDIGISQYHLRSIIYHEGLDDNVHGHYSCNCLIKCKSTPMKRGSDQPF